jgi:hypothetical protein
LVGLARAQEIREIQVDLSTGDDDLRSGSRATLALIGRDAAGRTASLFAMPLTSDREKLSNGSSKSVVMPLPAPLVLANVESVEMQFTADRRALASKPSPEEFEPRGSISGST